MILVVGITEYRADIAARYEDCRLYGPIDLYAAVHKDTATTNIERTNPRI